MTVSSGSAIARSPIDSAPARGGDWDAIVVGAGPAGSATALLLAREGRSVLLVDRARFPRHKPCSEYLSPAATALLERLGADVLAAVERAPHAKLYGMRVVAPSGSVVCGRFARNGHSSPPYSFALPRRTLDTILVRAAARAGAVVREGTAVEDLVWEPGAVAGVLARADDGRRVQYRGRVVVGADGLRSIVARRSGGVCSSRPRRIAFTAHVRNVTGVDAVGELHVSELGYVGLGPVGDGVTTVALVLPLRAVRAGNRDYRREFFEELDRFPGLAGRFERRELARAVLATGPFARWARAPVRAGVILVGDAADFFDPFTGQGIYSALRGAELAASAIGAALQSTQGPLSRAALWPYARARRRAFAGKWLLERLIGLGVGWPALTDRVVERLARRPELADLLVSATGNIVPARRALAPHVLANLLW